jgi:hypothetical protein
MQFQNLSCVRLPLIILCLAFVSGVLGCNGSGNRIANDFSASAHTSLSNQVNTVSFSSVTTFKWDKVFIFGPYTPAKTIDAALGYNWSSRAKARLERSDTEHLVVFTKNGTVVRYCEFNRKFGDFESLKSGTSFPYGADIFSVKQETNSGGLIYTPNTMGTVKQQ